MKPNKPESMLNQPFEAIRSLLRDEIEAMAREAGSSVGGTGPDSNGRYPESRSSNKERREILNQILQNDPMLNLPGEKLLKQFDSTEAWLKAFGDHIQFKGQSVSEPLCLFIETRFGIEIPRKDPSQIRRENLAFSLAQSLTLSREKILERLGHGEHTPDEEDEIVHTLIANYLKT